MSALLEPIPLREQLAARGIRMAVRPYEGERYWFRFGDRDGTIDLHRGSWWRWELAPTPRPIGELLGETSGSAVTTALPDREAVPAAVDVAPVTRLAGVSPANRPDLQPFVQECLARGFTLDEREATPRPDVNGLGNILLRWRGKLYCALPGTKCLVESGTFNGFELEHFLVEGGAGAVSPDSALSQPVGSECSGPDRRVGGLPHGDVASAKFAPEAGKSSPPRQLALFAAPDSPLPGGHYLCGQD